MSASPNSFSQIKPLIGLFVMGAAVLSILMSGKPNFTNDDAERILSDLSKHIAEEASYRGRESRLKYNAIEMNGWAYEKWARISQLSMDLVYPMLDGAMRVGFSTNRADLIPDPSGNSRISFKLPDVMNVIVGSDLVAMIHPSAPIHYTYQPSNSGNADVSVIHSMKVDNSLDISFPSIKKQLALKFTKPISAEINFKKALHAFRTQLTAGTTQLSWGGDHWQVGSIDIHYDEANKTNEVLEGKATLIVERVKLMTAGIELPALTFTMAGSIKERRNMSGNIDSSVMTIERGLLSDGNIKIVADGTVNLDVDDALYGAITLEINDVDLLIESAWIAPDQRDLMREMLGDIMGSDATPRKQAIINISRDKNEVWHIGKTTLQALVDKGLYQLFTFYRKAENEGAEKTNTP